MAEHLPTELLLQIFSYLDFVDLKSCADVCRKWFDIGTLPCLWGHFEFDSFSVGKKGLEHFLKVIKLSRFSRLTRLEITDISNWKDKSGDDKIQPFLNHFDGLNSLEVLTLNKVHISKIPAVSLAKCVLNIKTVIINPLSTISNFQAEVLFNNISHTKQIKLESLTLNNCDISSVDPQQFSVSVNSLKKISLQLSILSKQQILALFQTMSEGTLLQSFELDDYYGTSTYVRDMDGNVLARALNNLQHLIFSCEVPVEFFNQLATNSRLKSMSIPRSSALLCPADTLAKALNNLEQLDIENDLNGQDYFGNLDEDQSIQLFQQMARKTKLNKITIELNNSTSILYFGDFIYQDLLTSAIASVPEVHLRTKSDNMGDINFIIDNIKQGSRLERLVITIDGKSWMLSTIKQDTS